MCNCAGKQRGIYYNDLLPLLELGFDPTWVLVGMSPAFPFEKAAMQLWTHKTVLYPPPHSPSGLRGQSEQSYSNSFDHSARTLLRLC